MAFTDDYDLEFQRALEDDPHADWARWLPQRDDAEAHELACQLFMIGAQKLGWDFQWLYDKWDRYQNFLRGHDDIAAIRELHELQYDFRLTPSWSQYEPFGISADKLQLKSKEEPEDPLYLGQVLGNTYRIEHRVSYGGFGLVYRATSLTDDDSVIIKVPRMHHDPSRVEFACGQIRTEAKLLQAAAGPGIREFHALLEDNGMPILVLEDIAGVPLSAVPSDTAEDVRTILGYLADIAETLDRLHASGFIHRDVKPGNILVSRTGSVCLIDFGICLDEQTQFVEEERSVGSWGFAAPSLLSSDNHELDEKSDLWSIGEILADLFLEDMPKPNSPSREEVINAHVLSQQAIDSNEHVFPPGIFWIIRHCRSLEVGRCFERGNELAAAIRAWLGGEEPSDVIGEPDASLAFWRLGMSLAKAIGLSRTLIMGWSVDSQSYRQNPVEFTNWMKGGAYIMRFMLERVRECATSGVGIDTDILNNDTINYFSEFHAMSDEIATPEILNMLRSRLFQITDLLLDVLDKNEAIAEGVSRKAACLLRFPPRLTMGNLDGARALSQEAGIPKEVWDSLGRQLVITPNAENAPLAYYKLIRRIERFLVYGDDARFHDLDFVEDEVRSSIREFCRRVV